MLMRSLEAKARQSMVAWLDNNNPAGPDHRLHLKNLFIYPTRLGWSFLVLAAIVWLLGTNYQNNLILALSYFQISIFTVCILHTYHNLSGLKICYLSAQNVHCGESSNIKFSFECSGKKSVNHVIIYFAYELKNTFDFKHGEVHCETVLHPTHRRGRHELLRLRVESRFPMGLIKCGSWLRFDSTFLAYPKEQACDFPALSAHQQETGEYQVTRERQEFYGFRSYAPGDTMSAIAWKQWAKGRGLLSITYANPDSPLVDLGWDQFYSGDKEQALSELCYWTRRLHEQGDTYYLVLPNQKIKIDASDASLERALSALALA